MFVMATLTGLAVVAMAVAWLNGRQSGRETAGRTTAEHGGRKVSGFAERRWPTPNYDCRRENEVAGIVLHHTGETLEESLRILTSPERKVSTHVVIAADGTRYVMADPRVVTFHAGRSVLFGREHCNYCTIGVEFQGNTLVAPLTDEQIASAIEYLMPIIEAYRIPLNHIVTHEMVRNAYRERYPDRQCDVKVDITLHEYARFMGTLCSYLLIKDKICKLA